MTLIDTAPTFSMSCPGLLQDYPEVTMAHGAGGALTRDLINKMIAPLLSNQWLDENHDGAVLDFQNRQLAFTTDSYVIHPLEFPGGDIGHLAVCGTINDLAMCGARPEHLSLGLIIEEGLSMARLWRIVQSIGQTCKAAQVRVVTGDTKVVDRGKGDGLFINMSGIGEVVASSKIAPEKITNGDAVLISRDIGRHGIAVLSAREGLSFETEITSDCFPVHEMVLSLLDAGLDVHCMRDLTRGGLATALCELVETSGCGIEIRAADIPVQGGVRGACELLGLDPLYVANEGCFVTILPSDQAEAAVSVLNRFENGRDACVIGQVVGGNAKLALKTELGSLRQLDILTGEHLPRIC